MSQNRKLIYTARVHMTQAHTLCPYSRATHGNIEVTTTIVSMEPANV